MKRILLSLLSLFVLCLCVFATPISEGEAREKALQFMLSKKGESSARSAQRFGGSDGAGATLTVAEVQEAFYVFNVDSVGGYVIVSGDDRMPDVLGYSYSSTYKADEIPDNMRAWLEGYAEQYEYLQTHSDAKGATLATVRGDKILPLIECHWDQGTPYNNLCPLMKGKRTLTGCVATSMAQIMYYHQWPKQTKKVIPAYKTATNGLYVPERDITSIDWSVLTPTYSSASSSSEKNMVATLMCLCGSAVEMDYGLDVSNAYGNMAMNAFVKYFDYNNFSISNVGRNSVDDAVWNQMVYDELKDGRPVFYSGQKAPNDRHAFIVDGYDRDDYFHINWGWGGYADDYFLLGALRGYNYDQYAMTGIEKGHSSSKYAYAVLDEDSVLTYYYDNEYDSHQGTLLNWLSWMWDSQDFKQQIKKVVFDPSCADYKYLTNAGSMFEGFSNLVSIQGLEYLVTENITNMGGMFYGCRSLTSLDVSHFNTEKVTSMSFMFDECESLTTLDVSSFNTSKVTDMTEIFRFCTKLTTIDVSNFDTSNAEKLGWMFCGCSSLKHVDVSHFKTDKATIMTSMFWNCNSLEEIDVTSFNTKNVTSMGWMFLGCSSLTSLDISNFDTKNVTSMNSMFEGCNYLHTIYVGDNWNTDNVTESEWMFYDCNNLVGQAGTKYSYDNDGKEYARIDKGASAPGYFSSKTVGLRGDVNGDGIVNGTDIQAIINLIVESQYDEKGDVNGDGVVNGTDIQEVINIIVNAE